MWRNPRLITDLVAQGLWRTVRSSDLAIEEVTNTRLVATSDDVEAYRLLIAWLNETLILLQKHNGELTSSSQPSALFQFKLERMLVREVKSLTRQQNFQLLGEVFRPACALSGLLSDLGQPALGETISTIGMYLATAAMLLSGSETKALVGYRNGVPAWSTFPALRGEEIALHLALGNLVSYGVRHYIGNDDAWMVPTSREFDMAASESNSQDGEFLAINHALIEAAFSAQRYMINPNGVYVRLTNARNVTGLHLKARASDNHGLVDILVRFETDNGSFFTVITEERLLHPEAYADSYPSIDSYFAYLACQVYHDLVTASEVPRSAPAKATCGPAPSDHESYSWTVIPRRLRHACAPHSDEPRTAIPGAKPTAPRRVTGHLRNRPMTDSHRQVLEQFERDTGVNVLRYVPEGYTFVRPHFSPALSAEEFQELPRFIRYRIQESLIARMNHPDDN